MKIFTLFLATLLLLTSIEATELRQLKGKTGNSKDSHDRCTERNDECDDDDDCCGSKSVCIPAFFTAKVSRKVISNTNPLSGTTC